MYKTCLYLYYSLQVYIRHTSCICLYPSNIFVYTWYSTPNIYTSIYTNAYTRAHIYTHADVSTATGYPFRTLTIYEYRISVFQGVWITRVQDFTLEDFQYLVLAPLLRRLATDIASLSHSHTLTFPHSWPSTSMAYYRQQHLVNHNAAQVARTKPSQYDRLSTMDNGTNTMFFVTVVWRQQ